MIEIYKSILIVHQAIVLLFTLTDYELLIFKDWTALHLETEFVDLSQSLNFMLYSLYH